MAVRSGKDFETNLIPKFVPSIPGFQSQLESGIKLLDVGCGAGVAVRVLADEFQNSEFFGIDIAEEAIAVAKSKVGNRKNVNYEAMDAIHLKPEWTDNFDVVAAFDSIHDQPYPDKSLKVK